MEFSSAAVAVPVEPGGLRTGFRKGEAVFRGMPRVVRSLASIPVIIAVPIPATLRTPGSVVAARRIARDRRNYFTGNPRADGVALSPR